MLTVGLLVDNPVSASDRLIVSFTRLNHLPNAILCNPFCTGNITV